MIPREKTAQFSSAPPLNRLKSAARPPPVRWLRELRNHSCKTPWLTPGVVMAAPRRTITTTASVNKIRRRNSGILTVLRNAETLRYICCVAAETLGFLSCFLLECCVVAQSNRSTSLLNLFPSCRTHFVGFHFHRMFQFAVTQDFDSHEPTAHEVRFTQDFFVYEGSGLKRIEIVEVHNRIPFVKGCIVESALGQTTNQWHLPTFESQTNASTGARLLSFVTFATGLSVS